MEKIVKELIQEVLGLDQEVADNIKYDQALYDFGLDSIKAIELVVLIENKFDISVDDEELSIDNMESIDKIANLIRKYQESEG